jgi:bacterioferritin (cytochrome b1)
VATERRTIYRRLATGKLLVLVCGGLLAGCASSGDLEQIRQEARQGESALRADLMKEQTQFSTLAKENESLRASHAKISQSVKEYLKAEEARHVSALEQVRNAMKALE